MAYQYIQRAVVFAAILSSAVAQEADVIPADITAGFVSGEEIQVSYTQKATDGFKTGTTFEKDGMYSPRLSQSRI
jgi:hypothetical protein